MLEMVITGIIFDKAQTGYDIKKEIEYGVGNFYKVSYGSLYPALARMTTKGLLEMTESAGGRNKKFYCATQAGRDAFLAWLDAPHDPEAHENILLKVFFFGRLSVEQRAKRLAELQSFLELSTFRLRQIEAQLHELCPEADMATDDVVYFEVSTLYYGLANAITSGRWLAHLAARRPHEEFMKDQAEKKEK